jgi:hypothetical protein
MSILCLKLSSPRRRGSVATVEAAIEDLAIFSLLVVPLAGGLVDCSDFIRSGFPKPVKEMRSMSLIK